MLARRIASAVVVVFTLAVPGAADARVAVSGGSTGAHAGSALANAGDVNGDGIDDLVVGGYFAGADHRGSAYVVFGSSDRRPVDLSHLGQRGFEIRGSIGHAYAGFSVAGGRDVNGDGLADVVVGVPRYGLVPNQNHGGGAFVVFGKRDSGRVNLGSLGSRGFLVRGDWLGRSVSLAPDMNEDGRAEVVLGAGHTSGYGGGNAAAYVVFGKASTDSVRIDALGGGGFELDDRDMNVNGSAVAGLGDVNGDGRGDVVVGVRNENFPLGPGVAYLAFGKSDGAALDLTKGTAIRSTDPGALLGHSVADAGDTNGDGLHDVLVGAPQANDAHGFEAGAAYVVYGSRAPHDVAVEQLGSDGFSVLGARGGDAVLHGGEQLGFSVASAGDLNGDHRDDLVLGAPYAAGAAYVVKSPAGPAVIDLARRGSARRLTGARQLDQLGRAVAAAKLDGTGRSVALAGAPYAPHGGAVYTGSGARGRHDSIETLGPPRATYLFDDTHWAVLGDLFPGLMRLYDTRKAHHFDQQLAAGCAPTGARHGLVALSCYGPPSGNASSNDQVAHPFVYRISTRKVLTTAPGGPYGDDFVGGWYAVGAQWIAGGMTCYHCGTLWRNWHTGEELQEDALSDTGQCVNLDSPAARIVPCPSPDVIATEHGYTLRQHDRFTNGPITPLVLKQGRHSVRLSNCKQGCPQSSLSAGRVVWVEGATVRGYVIASRRRVTWRLPRSVQIAMYIRVTRLGREVIATLFDGSSLGVAPVAIPDVYRLRWPR